MVGSLISVYPMLDIPSQYEVPSRREFWCPVALVNIPSQLEVPRWRKFLISSYPCGPFKDNLKSDRGGLLISSYPCEDSKSTWSFQEGGNFWYPLTPCWTFKAILKFFHWGGNFDVFLPLWTSQVSLKFHGVGIRWNFDIFLLLWTPQVNLKFHGGGNFCLVNIPSELEVPCRLEFWCLLTFAGQVKSAWSLTSVEALISPYPCEHSKSIWSSREVGKFDIFSPSLTVQVSLKFHAGAHLDIFLPLFHGGGKFDIFFSLWTLQGKLAVPWGWEFWYLLTLENIPKSNWSSAGVKILISYFLCEHSKSTWPWWKFQVSLKIQGGGKFDIFLPLWTFQVTLKFRGAGNFDVFLPLWTFQVNLKIHGRGNFDIFLPIWIFQVNLKCRWGG